MRRILSHESVCAAAATSTCAAHRWPAPRSLASLGDPMDEHKRTMDYFMQELLTKEPHRQLQVVSQLPIICLALGPERTRETLLPWLKSEIEDTANIQHSDEVLVAIAYNLGRCHEFVGPVRLPAAPAPLLLHLPPSSSASARAQRVCTPE